MACGKSVIYTLETSPPALSCKSTSATERSGARADYGIVVLSTRRFTAMQMGKGSAGCRRQFVFGVLEVEGVADPISNFQQVINARFEITQRYIVSFDHRCFETRLQSQ